MARFQRLSYFVVVLGCITYATSVVYAAPGDDILEQLGAANDSPPPEKAASAKPDTAKSNEASAAKEEESAANDETKSQKAAVAQSPQALDKVKAVPRKTLLKKSRFELSPFASLSTNDAYYQHYAAGGTAIFYPHDAFGIGVGAEYLFSHLKTSNLDTVRQNFIAVPAVFEQPRIFAHLDAYFIPIYGKISLFSSDIIQFDTYLVSGVGAAYAGSHYRPLMNLGLGQRFVFGEWLAIRFELRDHMFVDTQTVNEIERSGVQNYLMFMAGVSVFLPTSFEYTYQ
ncbi:MAG: outer membrane beta-barrel domain-containing protein [Deltaproteobacteria bacterium]|nr:outer membrane beta-barrel domain-containing protein [Deltaproteobacteria bacterium]